MSPINEKDDSLEGFIEREQSIVLNAKQQQNQKQKEHSIEEYTGEINMNIVNQHNMNQQIVNQHNVNSQSVNSVNNSILSSANNRNNLKRTFNSQSKEPNFDLTRIRNQRSLTIHQSAFQTPRSQPRVQARRRLFGSFNSNPQTNLIYKNYIQQQQIAPSTTEHSTSSYYSTPAIKFNTNPTMIDARSRYSGNMNHGHSVYTPNNFRQNFNLGLSNIRYMRSVQPTSNKPVAMIVEEYDSDIEEDEQSVIRTPKNLNNGKFETFVLQNNEQNVAANNKKSNVNNIIPKYKSLDEISSIFTKDSVKEVDSSEQPKMFKNVLNICQFLLKHDKIMSTWLNQTKNEWHENSEIGNNILYSAQTKYPVLISFLSYISVRCQENSNSVITCVDQWIQQKRNQREKNHDIIVQKSTENHTQSKNDSDQSEKSENKKSNVNEITDVITDHLSSLSKIMKSPNDKTVKNDNKANDKELCPAGINCSDCRDVQRGTANKDSVLHCEKLVHVEAMPSVECKMSQEPQNEKNNGCQTSEVEKVAAQWIAVQRV